MKTKVRLALALFLLAMPSIAQAQKITPVPPQDAAPPSVPPADPKKEPLARELDNLLNLNTSKHVFTVILRTWRAIAAMGNPGKDDQIDRIAAEVGEKIHALHKDELKASAVKVYADMFTEEELGKLNEFFKSPAGQKYIETISRAGNRIMALNKDVVAQGGEEIKKTFAEELQKNNLHVPKGMGGKVDNRP